MSDSPTTKPEWIREKNWFFRLSRYQQPLLEHYRRDPGFIEPEIRRNEILRLVEGGLEDISMSRAGQSWGIPVPFDPASVVYVWFDALINYAAAVGYGWDDALYARWWPANLHVVGKDITRFHCVIWPAMLMSAKLPLPEQVFGHGWVYFKGERMSKTLGNIVDPLDAAERFGPDPLRLYLAKEVPYGGDGDFTWERFEEKYNADLANNLGNLVNRVASMTERYRQGTLTAPSSIPTGLMRAAEDARDTYREAMDRHGLHEATAAAFRLVSATNEFVAAKQPWALAKDPAMEQQLTDVLYDAAEAVRIAAVLLLPVMPTSAAEILRRMGDRRPAGEVRLHRRRLAAGETKQISNAGALWPRIEDKGAPVVSETPVPSNAPAPPAATPVSPAPAAAAPPAAVAAAAAGRRADCHRRLHEGGTANGEDPGRRRLPKSKKLLKLSVDAGEPQPRTILAGIAESYEPEAIVGRSIAHRRQPQAARDDGHRLERHGPGRQRRQRPGAAGQPDPAPPGTRVR